MKRKITIKTPGKLMIAGEFAVLAPYQPLIVTAVDRFVTTEIERASENRVTLVDFALHNLRWEYNDKHVTFHANDKRLSFIRDALATTLQYIEENNVTPTPVSITIMSELDDHKTGLKYGLGSSAAVVTAVVTALLTYFLKDKVKNELIFKLAAISHIKTQGNGSGADVAASTYGGVLHYTSFQAEWLQEQLQKIDCLSELVRKKWTYLTIENVQFPENVQFCVGWTGSPASTGNLVAQILTLKSKKPDVFQSFLDKSNNAVQTILQGMKENDVPTFLDGIKKNRAALVELANEAEVLLETDKLRMLSEITEQFSGAGKLSGAGGGDCGIGFIHEGTSIKSLYEKWQEATINPLNLHVSKVGSQAIENE